MKIAMLATVLAMSGILLTGCDGDHSNSVIVCSQSIIGGGVSVVGSGAAVGRTIWICEASYVDDNGAVHSHKIGDDYVGRYLGCQARRMELTAVVKVTTTRHGRGGTRTVVEVGQTYCSEPPSNGGGG